MDEAKTIDPFEKIPIVPPLVRRVEALEFTNPEIPGDIKVDIQGRLLKSWVEMEGILGSHIETYDNWIINVIKKQLASRTFRIPQGEVTVMNPVFYPPRISDSDNTWIPLTPQMARDNGYTYAAELYVDYVLNAGTAKEEKLTQSFFGKIPVMLGSVICHLRGKTDKEKIEMGECPSDPLGYFIIKGSEKVILIQEKLRTNRIFIYHPTTKDTVVCKMTCSTITGSSNVTITRGKKSNSLKIHLAFMGRSKGKSNKIGNTISVFQVYRMLGIKDPNQILQMISLFTKKEYIRKIWVQLQPTFVKLAQVGDDIEHISKKKGLGNMDYGIKRASIMRDLKNELFPHIPPENITQKLYMLSIMVARYAEYLIGERRLDDRDNWSNKRLESAGRSLEQLFGNIWRDVVTKAQDTIETKSLQGLQSVKREINSSFIADNFVSSFNSNNWGVQGSYMPKENITDTLKRDSVTAVYSHLTKINTPTNRRAKQIKIRLVQMSQLGYVCPVETPEGEQCLTLDTPVLKSDGSWSQIGDMRDGDNVITVDPSDYTRENSGIHSSFQYHTKERSKKLYRLTTVNGRTIRATEDHPFLTKDGWKTVDQIGPSDKVCVYPVMGPVSNEVSESVILDRNLFTKNLTGVVKTSLIDCHLKVLEEKKILPLRSTSSMVPVLARMGGYTLADGTLAVYNETPMLSESFGQKADAVSFEDDVERLGFDKVTIGYRETEITDKNTSRLTIHHTYRVQHSSALASLMIALGFSFGRKTSLPRKPVPHWIMNGSDLIKREFVSGFQGGDGTAIHYSKRKGKVKAYSFTIGETIQHIEPQYRNSMYKFMLQMGILIRDLGVEVTRVIVREDPNSSNLVALYDISRKEENLVKYMDVIGYRYCSTKLRKGMVVSEYLKYKRRIIKIRKQLKNTVIEMYKGGLTIRKIADKLSIRYRKAGSIIEYWREKGISTNTLAPPGTLTIEEFLATNPVHKDYIFLQLEKKDLVNPDYVADFTTVSQNHSFVANGFVTHNCGLVKNTSITNYISVERGENIILENISKYISNLPTEQLSTPLILNGKFMGWCAGESLRTHCVALRRRLILSKDTAIVLPNDGFLYIYTDAARPTRPLLIVDPSNNQLVIENKELWEADMQTLMEQGCVEYIDAFEQEYIQLAQGIEDIQARASELDEAVRNHQEAIERLAQLEAERDGTTREDPEVTIRKRTIEIVRTIEDAQEMVSQAANTLQDLQKLPPYTHSELDPTAILGIAASLIPLSNHNQAPRNTYQCSMGKQALGIYHSQHTQRFDTTSKCLAYPSRPLFQTQMDEVLGLNTLPAGDTVILAIMTYTGYNQEDAIIMNKAAIDRGLFRQVIYKSYKNVQKRTRNTVEEFTRPEVKKGEAPERYAAIDEKGIARLGSFVREGDCIIGKIRKNIVTGGVENASTYVGVGQKGIVDRVLVSTNPEGMRVVKVKLRQIRKPIMGDKFASRHAQKATIGLILDQEDMPFTSSGMTPDIIINPHCIPSRMTIAKMIEIVTSKIAAFSGERVNATAYRRFNVKEFKENLRQYGYSPSGKERLYSGFTGKPFEALIYTGPCYYQTLRHHVMDKIQMRSKGAIKQLSHQPVSGRARKGGQRFGEMERDAIISHGASAFLQERLCLVSDAYQAVYCSNCGTIAIANHVSDKFVCRSCDDDAKFGTCTIPYAYKLLTHMLAGAGFNLQFGMADEARPFPEITMGELPGELPQIELPGELPQIGLPQTVSDKPFDLDQFL